MVDAGPSLSRAGRASRSEPAATGWQAFVHGTEGVRVYAAACAGKVLAPPQDPLWVESFAGAGRAPPLVATLSRHGKVALALALEVGERGPFRYARFVGGTHANGNFPATDPAAAIPTDALERLVRAIRHARPDIDLLALERQLPVLSDTSNPFAALPHCESPNLALAVDLAGGFDAVLGRVNGKRKRKKHRSQLRKFEAAGGFRRIEAETAADVERLLAAFFAMRSERFVRIGLPDVFAEPEIRAAFRSVFTGALGRASRPFLLHGLEVGGRLRAVTGASRRGRMLVCEFCAFADDELTSASPGDFLFFENIREACERGMSVYDFSIGDEGYKRAWSDIETSHLDIRLPLTARGRILSAGLAATSQLKRVVKANPTLKSAALALRRGTGASPSDQD